MTGIYYRAKSEKHFNHTLRVNQEYKEKLLKLHEMGVQVAKSFRPIFYAWIDSTLEEVTKK